MLRTGNFSGHEAKGLFWFGPLIFFLIGISVSSFIEWVRKQAREYDSGMGMFLFSFRSGHSYARGNRAEPAGASIQSVYHYF